MSNMYINSTMNAIKSKVIISFLFIIYTKKKAEAYQNHVIIKNKSLFSLTHNTTPVFWFYKEINNCSTHLTFQHSYINDDNIILSDRIKNVVLESREPQTTN